MFNKLDHIAIAVRNTEEALTFYRDTLGLPMIKQETLDGPGVQLTHLDMGNVELQLVQPLSEDHPIAHWIQERGEGLHHLCWDAGDDIQTAMDRLPEFGLAPKPNEPHPAPLGGSAAFIEPNLTRGVLWEMTAKKPSKS
jgi:methylmalonyl-CoA epimerase